MDLSRFSNSGNPELAENIPLDRHEKTENAYMAKNGKTNDKSIQHRSQLRENNYRRFIFGPNFRHHFLYFLNENRTNVEFSL